MSALAPAYEYSTLTTEIYSPSDFFVCRPTKRRRLSREPYGQASNDTCFLSPEKSSTEVGQQIGLPQSGLPQAIEKRADTPGQAVSQDASAADVHYKTSDDSMNQEVCFGMLVDIEA